jgi:hypothetical protein
MARRPGPLRRARVDIPAGGAVRCGHIESSGVTGKVRLETGAVPQR